MSGALRLLPASLRARIEASPTLRRMVPNTGWLVADRLARMAVTLLVSMWVARYLGPDEYGRYNFAIAWVALFSAFTTLGLERIAVRELVHAPADSPAILGSALALRAIGGALAFLGSMGGLFLIRRGDHEMWVMVAIMSSVSLIQALDVIDYWNQSRMRARITVVAMRVGFLLSAIARLLLVVLHAPLIAFAGAWAAELVLGSLGLLVSYQVLEYRLFAWRMTRSRMASLFRDGWPLMLTSVLAMIYMRVDQVMLGQMSTAHELGIYAAAVKLVEVWYFLPMAIAASAFPSVVEARQVSTELFEQRLQRLYDLMSRLSYAIALPVSLAAPWLVRWIFGPAYEAAGPMLAVLIWSLLFTSLGLARGLFLSAMNWTWAYFMMAAAGCVANVVLNLLLIPRLGGMGAVIASCVAYWAAGHGACFLYRPLFRTGVMLTRALLPWRPRSRSSGAGA